MVVLVNMHLIKGTFAPATQLKLQGNSNGPLVPMVQFVPMRNDVILVVLLENMHFIKGTQIVFSCGLAGCMAIPMVHWYQWYD